MFTMRHSGARLLCCAVALAVVGVATVARGAGPRQTVTTKSGAEMIYLPGGSFVMGDPRGAPDERPHKVSIDAFYIDKYEVIQEHYRKIVGSDYSRWRNNKAPVEQVTWAAAVRYCNARSRAEGLTPCYDTKTWKCDVSANGYRLPTEAEWEYAARAGTATSHSFGDNPSALPNFAWMKENSGGRPREVGKKLPNPWGLYDMYGNVAEWCNDFYAVDYYQKSPARNPRGPASGSKRVVRGGSWNSRASDCRSSYRFSENPAYSDVCIGYYDVYGFRCVRNAGSASESRPSR
jgi:formylglycine-generating enzyme required for sulfatase activity